jgi:hypothetical protein
MALWNPEREKILSRKITTGKNYCPKPDLPGKKYPPQKK